jgi:hypothetical protein
MFTQPAGNCPAGFSMFAILETKKNGLFIFSLKMAHDLHSFGKLYRVDSGDVRMGLI